MPYYNQTGVPVTLGVREAETMWSAINDKLDRDTKDSFARSLIKTLEAKWNNFVYARGEYERAYKDMMQNSHMRFASPSGEWAYREAVKKKNLKENTLMLRAREVKDSIQRMKNSHPEIFIAVSDDKNPEPNA